MVKRGKKHGRPTTRPTKKRNDLKISDPRPPVQPDAEKGVKPEFVVVAHLREDSINVVRLGLARPGRTKATLIQDVPFTGGTPQAYFGTLQLVAQVAGSTVTNLFNGAVVALDVNRIKELCLTVCKNVQQELDRAVYQGDGVKHLQARPDGSIPPGGKVIQEGDQPTEGESRLVLPPGVSGIDASPQGPPDLGLSPEVRKR